MTLAEPFCFHGEQNNVGSSAKKGRTVEIAHRGIPLPMCGEEGARAGQDRWNSDNLHPASMAVKFEGIGFQP